jgi:epoxyqueuosine reductase QueG
MSFKSGLKSELENKGADFVHFVNISKLSNKQSKGYPNAILLGIVLSPAYIQKISATSDYVQKMRLNNQVKIDEFYLKEKKADRLADYIASYLKVKGFSAYSQSEDNLYETGFYDKKMKSTPLPHKTIACLAGLGWIGKHNLLVTAEFGSAICMRSVLTDAPLATVLHTPAQSLCGDCSICEEVCSIKAIKGNTWNLGISRDKLVDVYKCNTCLKCLALCPWTQKFMKKNIAQ